MLGKLIQLKGTKGFLFLLFLSVSFSQFAFSKNDDQYKKRLFYASKNVEKANLGTSEGKALRELKNLSRDYYRTVTKLFGARISRFFLALKIRSTYARLLKAQLHSEELEDAYADWESFDEIMKGSRISFF